MKTTTDSLMRKIHLLLNQWPTMTIERQQAELDELKTFLDVHSTEGKLPEVKESSLLWGHNKPKTVMLSQLLDKLHTEAGLALTTASHLPLHTRLQLLYTNIYSDLQAAVARIEYARRNM